MRKKRDPKKPDISSEFLQSMIDQDIKHTTSLLADASDAELRSIIRSVMAVATMLMTLAVRRGLDISQEASIVVELPGNGEEKPS